MCIPILDCTVAEIVRAAGDYPSVSDEDTARQVVKDRAFKDRVRQKVIR